VRDFVASDDMEDLDLESYLWACISVKQSEHERGYAEPETSDEKTLHAAMDALETYSLGLIATGGVREELAEPLSAFMPGSSMADKITSLLRYNLVRDRLHFAVAYDVVGRLRKLDERIANATLGYMVLQRASPSVTAAKYYERAARLYLAGYDGEVVIMCGAVLEAAMAERIPDTALRQAGVQPKHLRTGVYAIGQRMRLEQQRNLLSPEMRKLFWEVVNWRNDAVHVQPDIGPEPQKALVFTAAVLGAILPRVL
jgi:hypothetical protein